MKSNKSISVVLPAFNEEQIIEKNVRYVYECLDKDFEDFELIVVDDASTDSSPKILQKLASELPNLMLLHNYVNLNQGTSFQRGAGAATKEIVTHNAIDLALDPKEYKKLVEEQFSTADVLVLQRKIYAGATAWRKFVSFANKALRGLLFPKLTSGIVDMNFVQFYKQKHLKALLPLSKSPAFTTPEMIFRAKLLGLKVETLDFDYQPREVGNGSLGKFHDIAWSMYDMFRFRYLLWIGFKKNAVQPNEYNFK